MKLYMPETFPYGKRTWYPHMKPYDISIWEAFMSEFPLMYDHVQYDVACGDGPQFDTLIDANTGGHAEMLYKKKIDVVAFKGAQIDIIELKPNASAASIGQVKMYRLLYIKDYNPPVTPKCIVITDNPTPNLGEFAHAEGVLLVVV